MDKTTIKEISLTTLLIFIIWFFLNYIINGILLQPIYEQTIELWRPVLLTKIIILSYVINFILALGFVLTYKFFILKKSLKTALKFSLIYGIVIGVQIGFIPYTLIPISALLAFSWFIYFVCIILIAGLISGLMIKS